MHDAITAAVEACEDLLGADAIAVLLPDRGRLRPVARRGLTAAQAAALAAIIQEDRAPPSLATWLGDGPATLAGWAEPLGLKLAMVRMDGAGIPLAALVVGVRGAERPGTMLRHGTALVAGQLQVGLAAARRVVEVERRQTPEPDTAPSAQIDPVERITGALTSVLRVTATAPTVSAACDATLPVLLDALPGVDVAFAWELAGGDDRLRRVAQAGMAPRQAGPADVITLDQPAGIALAVKENRATVWRGDLALWPQRLRNFARRGSYQTAALAPMYSGGRVVGALSLFARADRPFSTTELAFLTTVGGQLGGRIDTLRAGALVEEERRGLRSVIETLPEGLLLYDRDGKLRLFNQAAMTLLSGGAIAPTPAERGAFAVRSQAQPDFLPVAQVLREQLGREVRGAEVTLRRPDGAEVPLLVNTGRLHAADGGLDGTVVVFQDISQLKELDRLKDDFVNTVSHELRTPTTTIRGGALTLLRRGDRLDEETRRVLLQDIADESERLHHLVEDLLSLSRSKRGLHLSPEPLRLHRLVSRVVIGLGSRLGGVPLSVDVPAELPLAEADPTAVEQILRNLIENAVRHSPRAGRVEVTAAPHEAGVVVSVLDRGVGLAADERERVFEPFYRSPNAVAAGTQGAGLGLAVCRQLVEMSGGRIWVEPRPRGGTIVRFTLPAAGDVE